MIKLKINLPSLKQKFFNILEKLQKYSFALFILLVVVLYGVVLLKIHSLSNQQPSRQSVSDQVQAAKIPRIDQGVVSQLQSLRDNSVVVQSLLDQARSNPFKE